MISVLPQERDATEELYRNKRVLRKTFLLPSYSLPHILHLFCIAFFSLSLFLVFSEFVNSMNDWFWDRGALREGKSVVISKLSGILCLCYESCMHHFLDSWCQYADIVGWDNTSAVIQYTMRVHSQMCLRQYVQNYRIHKQRGLDYKINLKKQTAVLVLIKCTTRCSVTTSSGTHSLNVYSLIKALLQSL